MQLSDQETTFAFLVPKLTVPLVVPKPQPVIVTVLPATPINGSIFPISGADSFVAVYCHTADCPAPK